MNFKKKSMAAGETIFLEEYTLSDMSYWSVNNLRQSGEPLECIAEVLP